MNSRWVPLSSLRDAVRMALTGQLKTTAESIGDVSYLFVLWVEKKKNSLVPRPLPGFGAGRRIKLRRA